MSKTSGTAELNGGGPSPNEPLIQQKYNEDAMAKALDEKEIDGAVYKSTLDQVELKQASKYVGLTKEELEQYVNDPFWRRLRYIFLILFWLSWIAMFVGAIVIVIMSPKCPPKPQLEWYEKKMCYQIWTRSFQDSDNDGVGDLAGITDRLKHLVLLKANAIWPTPLLRSTSNAGYDVEDHLAVDPELGGVRDFENLVKAAHKYGIAFIMDLPMATVSVRHDWFNKSVQQIGEYDQYFRWSDVQMDSETYSPVSGRPGFYRHWSGLPNYAVLNYDHEAVRAAMKRVAKFWLDKGVDGFYLGEVRYMSLSDDGKPNWNKIHSYLKDFNEYVRKEAADRRVLTFTSATSEDANLGVAADDFKFDMRVKSDVNYVINNELSFVNSSCGSQCLQQHVQRIAEHHQTNNMSWPMWEIGHPYISRVTSRMGGRARAEMLSMLLTTLPGSINVYYGDEIGMIDATDSAASDRNKPRAPMQWSDEINAGFTTAEKPYIPVNNDFKEVNVKSMSSAKRSILRLLRRMASLRRTEDALLHGRLKSSATDDLLVAHVSSDHSPISYLTILNFGNKNAYNVLNAPFNVNAAGKDVTLVTATTNFGNRGALAERQPIDLSKLELHADEGVVVKIKA